MVEGSDLFTSLRGALDAARHVHAEIVVSPFASRSFGLRASVAVDTAHVADDVLAAVEAALAEAFSFEARAFGQSVSTAEVLAAMQAVGGVVSVDLDALGGADPFANPWLMARPARWEGGAIRPAELLTVDPARIDLTATAP